jgi:hypothetical protein
VADGWMVGKWALIWYLHTRIVILNNNNTINEANKHKLITIINNNQVSAEFFKKCVLVNNAHKKNIHFVAEK